MPNMKEIKNTVYNTSVVFHSIILCLPAHTDIGKACLFCQSPVINVSKVCKKVSFHLLLKLNQIQPPELIPFGQDNHCIGILGWVRGNRLSQAP